MPWWAWILATIGACDAAFLVLGWRHAHRDRRLKLSRSKFPDLYRIIDGARDYDGEPFRLPDLRESFKRKEDDAQDHPGR